MVVISAGADNRYARPNTEVLTRLGQAVSADRVYQPAQQGRIELVTDGYRLWVESQR